MVLTTRTADESICADILSWYTDGITCDQWVDLLSEVSDDTLANLCEFAHDMEDLR